MILLILKLPFAGISNFLEKGHQIHKNRFSYSKFWVFMIWITYGVLGFFYFRCFSRDIIDLKYISLSNMKAYLSYICFKIQMLSQKVNIRFALTRSVDESLSRNFRFIHVCMYVLPRYLYKWFVRIQNCVTSLSKDVLDLVCVSIKGRLLKSHGVNSPPPILLGVSKETI